MKFDLIISNPPYNDGLDLKILKSVYETSEKICFIHPAGWLYDNKGKSKLINQIKGIFCKNIKNILILKTNDYFGLNINMPSSITYITNKTYEKIDVEDDFRSLKYKDVIENIDVHGNSKIYKSLKNKILNYCINKENLLNKKGVDLSKNVLTIGGIGTTLVNHHLKHCFVFLRTIDETKERKKGIYFNFNNKNEIINFKDYLKTKIARFCLSIYKINQNLDRGEIASVPYMPTYTRPWTDEDVAKELGLTDEELQWAIDWIPDYYPEDSIKYEK